MKYNKKQHTKLSCRSKCFFLALALAMASVDASAQKISLGSCITRDGGQFKGEMVSGKPQGKGTTIYKNGDTYEGSYMKGKREGYGVYTFSDGKSMRDSGCRTNSMVKASTISRTTTNM